MWKSVALSILYIYLSRPWNNDSLTDSYLQTNASASLHACSHVILSSRPTLLLSLAGATTSWTLPCLSLSSSFVSTQTRLTESFASVLSRRKLPRPRKKRPRHLLTPLLLPCVSDPYFLIVSVSAFTHSRLFSCGCGSYCCSNDGYGCWFHAWPVPRCWSAALHEHRRLLLSSSSCLFLSCVLLLLCIFLLSKQKTKHP